MKTLLVTGGAGFIGSNFIRHILNTHPDYRIINIDKLTYCGNRNNLKDVQQSKNYMFIKGDICDPKTVSQAMKGCDLIINFAAQTHVDRSIKDSSEFIRTNIEGLQVLLDAAGKCKVKRFLQISCYDEKTRALTTEGLKTFKELKKGDRVFSLNALTHKIELKPVEKVIIQQYSGEMIHFKNKRIDLFVTPNHRMFILNTKRKLVVEEADKVSRRSIFYFPEGYWKGKNESDIYIKGHGRVKAEDLMYILGIFIGDGFTAYQEKSMVTKSGLTREEFLKKARDKRTGRFKKIEMASDYKAKCHSYRIFFDIPESDRCRKKVEKTLTNLGIKYNFHKGKAGTHLYFTSKVFMKLFDKCGKGARNKHIPRWALNYSPKYLRYLLQGMLDSDGSRNRVYYTASERLAADICELCIKLKLKPSIHKRHTAMFFNGRKIEGNSYYIFIGRTPMSITRNRNNKVKYTGKIWCVKVKDNKNLVVERNGRFVFCGNTDEVYGDVKRGLSKEKDALLPNSPYAATKAAADLLCRAYFKTYKLPVIIARSSNNFGPYQYPEKVMPLFMTNAIENRALPLYGDGRNVRDWIYVVDNCSALDLVLHRGRPGEIYNIGGGNQIRNIKIAREILTLLGRDKEQISFVTDRPGHDRRYALDSAKIKELGWEAEYNFKKALRLTIEWYISNEWWWRPLKRKARIIKW